MALNNHSQTNIKNNLNLKSLILNLTQATIKNNLNLKSLILNLT